MKRTVEFEHDIDDRVKTPFGNKGIITSLSYDNTRSLQYYVDSEKAHAWYRGDQLEPWKDE